MSHVREEDISNLQIFSGGWLGHDDAAQLLRIYSHNVETALNKVLDAGPEGVGELLRQQNTGWDNTAFGADRYGNNDATGSIPTFNIEYAPGVDNYPHSGGPSGAPTRPSSRTSQRSGVSAHAGDTPRQSVESGQESGVIGGSGTYGPVFGPATREHYEANSWALVPATKSTEYIPDAAMLFQSRHDSGAPAFIKPVPNPDRLPEALTILHSIPLFRNALLAPQISNNNYWLGSDWWKGQPSALARTVDGSSTSEAANELDLIYETQRLVAFLDDSDRSYANIESMYQLDIWKQQIRVSPEEPDDLNDDLLKFLLRWNWAYERHAPELALDGVFQSTINVGGQHNKSFLLDAEVQPCKESEQRNLYDVLDSHLFNIDAGRAHIVQPSDVLILRLHSTKDSLDLDCQIPDTFYADRYLEDNRGPVDEICDQIKEYNKQQTTIDTAVEGLKFHTPQKVEYSRKMDALTLLKTSMKAFEPDDDGVQQDPKHAAVLAQLQSIHQNIERKLSSLEEERKKISDAIDGIWAEFRAPLNKPDEVESTSKHKFNRPYKLCGLATSSSDTYNLYLDGKSGKSVAKGWWHIKYHVTGDEASISREQVALDEVLQTCLKTSKALLIYANDAATSVSPVELSKPLKNFVQKDNFNLLQELSEEKRDWQDSKPDEGAKVVGTWDAQDPDPPDYTDDWNAVSAKDFYQGDSGVSSTTLTPNTEMDDDNVGMEMQEVNGGINAWAGISNASSDTVGEPMDVSETQATVNIRDVEMSEAETPANVEPRVEHIEVVEKKGG